MTELGFSELFNRVLNSQGRTKKWLAEKTGIPQNTLNSKFSRNSFDLCDILEIKIALGLKMEDLQLRMRHLLSYVLRPDADIVYFCEECLTVFGDRRNYQTALEEAKERGETLEDMCPNKACTGSNQDLYVLGMTVDEIFEGIDDKEYIVLDSRLERVSDDTKHILQFKFEDDDYNSPFKLESKRTK